MESVKTATGKQLTAFFTGLAGGEIARRVTREAMKDDQGNVSILGELFALAVDAGVSYVIDETASELAQTKATLKRDLKSSADTLISKIASDGNASQTIRKEWDSLYLLHHNSCEAGLAKFLGIDLKWARRTYLANAAK